MLSPLLMLAPLAGPPRMEPPRPDLARPYATLNGPWEFCFDPEGTGTVRGLERLGATGYDRTITVPYPWESKLSGIGVTDYKGVAWYRRTFDVPDHPAGHRIHLCFGAVDDRCRVWVNGYLVGEHDGGYTPFRLDVTPYVKPRGNTVVVRVFDETDPHRPTGKQVYWYTPTSGLWQPVWLEAVAPAHVVSLATDCKLVPAQVTVTATVFSPDRVNAILAVASPDHAFAPVRREVSLDPGLNAVDLAVPVPGGRPWSPEEPHLYGYTLTVESDGKTDTVESYFGLRTISVGDGPGGEHTVIKLNDRPVYLRGALHQVFNPEGIYTFTTDEAIRHDLELAKQLGWNYLRLHIKLVDPRFLYWADRLGVLLMADLPNTWAYSPRARDAYEQMLREAIPRDRTHPSVIAWCCFNETWGLGELKQRPDIQAWVAAMWSLTKELDPTRLAEDNSACNYDHVTGDLNSWHFYIDDYQGARGHIRHVVDETHPGSAFNFCPGHVQGTQPLMNSEYGNVSAGGGDRDVSWGFKYLTTLLRAERKVQGYVYTEHCDIEWEHNGLVCYDRTPKVFGYDAFVPGMAPADLQGADFVGYDGPPAVTAERGGTINVKPFVSHYSAEAGPFTLRWSVRGTDDLGRPVEGAHGEAPVKVAAADVVVQDALIVPVPAELAIGAIGLELLAGGQRVAANYVNVLAPRDQPAAEALDARTVALRFRPGAIAAADAPESPDLLAYLERDKLSATGRPSFTWHLRLPAALKGATLEQLTLLVEAGARGGDAKLDWPAKRNRLDYPQTKLGRTTPSTLAASLDGVSLGTAALTDDYADARGVLSHLAGWDHGSHGDRIELNLDLAAHPDLAAKLARGETVALTLNVPADAKDAHGLSLYGGRMGRYGFAPTLLLTGKLPVAAGWQDAAPVTVDELSAHRTTLVPTAETAKATWRYTTAAPAKGWEQPGFADAAWTEGPAGFGTAGTPGAIVGTTWNTDDLWLRTRFTLDAPLGEHDVAMLRYHHDEDVQVYLNGKPVLERTGYIQRYEEQVLSPEARAALKPGENVLAVHCHQTVGGQYVDVGVSVLRAKG